MDSLFHDSDELGMDFDMKQQEKSNIKTLICVEGMPYAERTLQYGNTIASLLAATVTLMTVVNDVREETAASAMLLQAKKHITVPVAETIVRQGKSVVEIVQSACADTDHCFDMIIMGSHQISSLSHLFSRTVSQKVTDRAPVSVLVVKGERPSLKNILVCVGGQQMNPAVVEWGATLAKASGAKMQLLYVSNPVPGMYAGLEEMDETLPELLQSNTPIARHLRWGARYLADYGVAAEIKVRHGIAVDEILLEAQERQYDLLVIGARAEMTLLNELLTDKVTPHIVDEAPCSVLVVRGKLD